jgi:hypothetical protein
MNARLVSKSLNAPVRLMMIVMLLAVLVLSLPGRVFASGEAVIPGFDILAAKADESVTIRTNNFPADVKFTVRMDVAGNAAVNGIVVGETNSGKGGSFDATYQIPAELKGAKTIAIRLESDRGYYSYNWFNNRTFGSTTGGNTGTNNPPTSTKPYLNITGVKKNESVTVKAFNLPANTTFRVRVGPFSSFFRDYVEVTTINSGSTGNVEFTVNLPQVVRNVEMVTIRIDGGGRYAYNAFKNVDGGTVTTPTQPTTSRCQVTSVSPSVPLNKGQDFDGKWTIKNTSNQNWEMSAVDYKFVGGTKMHTQADAFDLPQTVKPGESITIVVDMLAPSTAGSYSTTWALVQGSTTLCNLNLNVRVR